MPPLLTEEERLSQNLTFAELAPLDFCKYDQSTFKMHEWKINNIVNNDEVQRDQTRKHFSRMRTTHLPTV